ncbi:2-dehydro-3-deoxyphosphogluconate aldolase / (4S)-4-hydroxy-2-oxoglutarate aldolase [Desulfotomaculum arcticum]|uniref:2-dehydro-3-deoxyphosphogluconate aldolase / (4S)-4-hydroxy-2-oxoglutarate aldolase n=1 Tax=Desulfotruncus arcticus DSM 17038 TaxID=1121424 RepID=A0A1I2YGU8_9FIRM|nr:bifunctional 2-keto-4-hydroxyglutarate aldolase/2-keto-3-deoxy-6-phosphogluconate aldolase [Desulfotruncus arcticus]SFH24657.1 2-dehydro-3-deoxyphosphogluconate aldolase / (4S)-4-hydroxy-2-oxoglutarate aldolase [Desulfotomaculum arcticum] [Desulfotruncus arcticus DSM 17038]
MKKLEILHKIIESGVVAVIRADNAEKAKKIVAAVKAGGISAIEVTMTVPGAIDVIKELANYKDSDIVLGVGSVLDPETARAAILAGAEYVVSPHLNPEVIKLCNRYQIPCMVGGATPTEVVEALEAGVDIIKVFPGEVVGPKFIKAVRGPIPQAPMMPTGGVALDNVKDWFAAGAVAVGVGGALTAGAKTGDYNLVTETARQFVAKFKEATGNK